ncbi:hypothetical protein D915_006000 [Fasciola hepatica]|uniref:G-protein coupled receptors family 1 profile domain-containing protein n=1 Tax=Fasciola hepatica TaxID=6192 RepID=A0A4E0RAH4_FASHE|nr:hypothetical protein D915_006000 [Fasciola hepatica]
MEKIEHYTSFQLHDNLHLLNQSSNLKHGMNKTNSTTQALFVGDIASEFNMIQPLSSQLGIAFWKIVPLSILLIWTLTSNGLLTCAIFNKPALRTQSNLLIGHQAAVDFTVGLLCMTVSATKDVLGFWPYSIEAAVIWLHCRKVLFTASVWSTTSIAIDRCVAIAYPQWYVLGVEQKKRRIFIYCVMIWTISFGIAFPILFTIPQRIRVLYEIQNQTSEATIIFNADPLYNTYAVCGSLLIPLLTMFVSYGRLLVLMKKQRRKIQSTQIRISEIPKAVPKLRRSSSVRIHKLVSGTDSSTGTTKHLPKRFVPHVRSMLVVADVCSEKPNVDDAVHAAPFHQLGNRHPVVNTSSAPVIRRSASPVKLMREQRATWMVIMVITFQVIACLPYSLAYLISLFKSRFLMNKNGVPGGFVQRAFVWDSYANVALNPIAYAVFNRGLRQSFLPFFKPFRCKTSHPCFPAQHP